MRKTLSTILFFLLTATICWSQDIITKKSGEDIHAKILEISINEVRYKKYDNIEGPTYSVLKSDLLMVRYENGTNDVFYDENSEGINTTVNDTGYNMYFQGEKDASIYYRGYKGAGTGTLITGLVSPLAGLIPAAICSSTSPRDSKLNYPNASLMENPEYYSGYTQKAKKIKRGKVWKNWGIAFGVNVAAALFLLSSSQ